ncbi:flavin monoamine oxidase family protein [Methylobacterium mesophilicum]|uniref:flavin monoamine oxidase family protein n=1 Tax=Methylobacterium mesophilicum TaxID=39956 RepID=UPI001FCE38DA|nr:NAD(P)/FAD-dependent oxidoreductase [Methylobacterium mesophilicum]
MGAGAAGLAAGRRLSAGRPELRIQVLEAQDRTGGRAHTVVPDAVGAPLDLGCGWLHGAERNPWLAIAGDFGFHVDRTPAPWDVQYRDLGFPPADQRAYEAASEAFQARQAAAQGDPVDRPLGALLEPDDPWNGLLNAVSTYVSGAELDDLSTHDAARYQVHGSDWRVTEGYGRLVARYGDGLPVALGTPVSRVDHGAAGPVRLETPRGTLRAGAVVVTVSTNVLAEGAIRFDPPLPGKQAAAHALPLGLANKVFLHLVRPEELPADAHLIGNPRSARTGAYHLRPFGRPVIEGYLGGALARDLERAGSGAAAAFALDELVALLGADFRRRATLLTATRWGQDAAIRGSYAYARPGAADRRAVLAAPVGERLFFAGEATSPDAFTTVRGAYESGRRAADEVLAALGGQAVGPSRGPAR